MVRKIVFCFSLALYIASLFLPVWNCNSKELIGSDVLIVGWMGILGLDPRWFCNLIIVVAGCSLGGRPSSLVIGWCFVWAAIASTTVFGPYFCGPVGGAFGTDGKSMALGGYLWIASLWIASLSTLDESDLASGDQ